MIGICGSGMSALAVLFKESGWSVTGSDEGAFEPIPTHLKKNQIPFFTKYNKNNIPKDVDLVVVGNNSPLSKEQNEETRYAVESGLKIESLPEALALLAKEKVSTVVVVGSLGKSTMTALISWCLFSSKKDPSYFIGAIPLDLNNSSHLGEGPDFIIEGDEYPSSHSDRGSKFLHFNPTNVILTSGLHDHINIFPTEESYKEPYKKIMAKIPEKGLLAYALHGTNNKEISSYAKCRKTTYSLDKNDADWYTTNIKYGMVSSFDLMHKGEKVISINTNLLGMHNIENVVGAAALLLENNKISPPEFAKAIESFHGVKGRIELKNTKSTVPVYEGFGPSYEKAKTVFDTMHLHFPNRKIIAVFEPHAFSWRNSEFIHWYRNIFDNVDEVVILPATNHGQKAKTQLETEEIWTEAKKYKNIHTAQGEEEALRILETIANKDTVIALVSSGPLFGLKESVPKLMDRKFPK